MIDRSEPLIDTLYSEEFDFPARTPVRTSYMLATVPRSGSSHCAIQFWKTGQLGSPLEYLNLADMKRIFMPRIQQVETGTQDLKCYWQKVLDLRTSPNGVFGYKAFMQNLYVIVRHHQELFDRIQPDFIVYLTRKDIVAQAVSYSRAMRTAVWFADQFTERGEVLYDESHVEKCIELLKRQYAYWEEVFARAKINPIRICYEDLIADSAGTVEHVLNAMDISSRGPALAIPDLHRQSDRVSTLWKETFAERNTQEVQRADKA